MINMYKKDNLQVLVGRVDQVRFEEKDDTRQAVVRLVDRKGDKVDVYFKNDLSSPENPKKLADRIEKAKVEAGKWLTMLVLMEDKSTYATGLDFKYQGIWTFDQDKDDNGKPKVNIAVGYATSPTRVNENLFRVSMAERTYDKETKEEGTRWYSIAFFDDDRDLTAKKAENLLGVKDRKSTLCAIRCSAVREVESDNGNTYYNLTGYRIESMIDKEAAVNKEVSNAA